MKTPLARLVKTRLRRSFNTPLRGSFEYGPAALV
jgi:hypothetical protein